MLVESCVREGPVVVFGQYKMNYMARLSEKPEELERQTGRQFALVVEGGYVAISGKGKQQIPGPS